MGITDRNRDLPSVVSEVGKHAAGTEIDTSAEDGIPDVAQVRGLGSRQENGPLDLGVGTDDAVVSDPISASQVRSGANHHVVADSDGPFDESTRLYASTAANDDPISQEVDFRRQRAVDGTGR